MEGTRGEERGEGSEEREGEEKRRKRLGGERRTAEGQVEIEPPLSGVLLRVEKGRSSSVYTKISLLRLSLQEQLQNAELSSEKNCRTFSKAGEGSGTKRREKSHEEALQEHDK